MMASACAARRAVRWKCTARAPDCVCDLADGFPSAGLIAKRRWHRWLGVRDHLVPRGQPSLGSYALACARAVTPGRRRRLDASPGRDAKTSAWQGGQRAIAIAARAAAGRPHFPTKPQSTMSVVVCGCVWLVGLVVEWARWCRALPSRVEMRRPPPTGYP